MSRQLRAQGQRRAIAAHVTRVVIEYQHNDDLVDYLHTYVGQCSVFLEVGAYGAEFSKRIASERPDAHIIALEANPYTHSLLVDSMPEPVEYLNVAACDTDSPVTFQIMSVVGGAHINQVAGNNSLRVRMHDGIEYESVTVQGKRIDTVLAERGLLGAECMVWIDVEGCQDLVLSGGIDTLTHTRALMIEVETHAYWHGQPLADDIDALLVGAGLTLMARDCEFPDQHNRVYAR